MTKPDFSGEWALRVDASGLSPAVAAAVTSGSLRIEHQEPTIAVHLRVVFKDTAFDAKFERVTDGREVRATHNGQQFMSSACWDHDALVFTDREHGPAGDVTIEFRYELEDGGRQLRAAEQMRGRGRDQENVWVFVKRRGRAD